MTIFCSIWYLGKRFLCIDNSRRNKLVKMLSLSRSFLYNVAENKISLFFLTNISYNRIKKGGFNIYKKLEARSQQLDRLIKETNRKLKNLPEGKLICSGNKCYLSDGHQKIYIKKKDEKLAQQLANKKYLSALLEDLEKEKSATDMYLRHCPKTKKADQLFAASDIFQNLLSPYFSPLSKELDNWMKSPYTTNTKHPEYLTVKVGPNEFVRSKSEAMIAKLLKQHQIPYRYESQIVLDDMEIYPDFTIRHPKTGELYIWEHFGLLDNPQYLKNMHGKMQTYTANNFLPGINLITTFETLEKPLTFEMIEMQIQYYFT